MKVKGESEKVGLKSTFRKLRSWHLVPSLHGKYMRKQWQNLFFWGSQVTADGDCSHEIKRRLLLGRKVMTNVDSILKKQRHYFVHKGPSRPGYGFSSSHVWMWELDYKESWALKNWCFWTARRSNQSILKEISPGISLEGMMLKLKLQDFGHLMRRVDSLEKTFMLGKIESRRKRGDRGKNGWIASLTQRLWVWANSRR